MGKREGGRKGDGCAMLTTTTQLYRAQHAYRVGHEAARSDARSMASIIDKHVGSAMAAIPAPRARWQSNLREIRRVVGKPKANAAERSLLRKEGPERLQQLRLWVLAEVRHQVSNQAPQPKHSSPSSNPHNFPFTFLDSRPSASTSTTYRVRLCRVHPRLDGLDQHAGRKRRRVGRDAVC